MKKLLIIILMALSFSAIGQEKIISGVGERPTSITFARGYVYFYSPSMEYTNFEITVHSQLSGVIYNSSFMCTGEFKHTYQLPGPDWFGISFFCYNFITQHQHTYYMIINYE